MATAQYLELNPCCNLTLSLKFKPTYILSDGDGIYRYDGPTVNGLIEGYCYNITLKTGTTSYVNSLPVVNVNDLFYDEEQNCENEKCATCPACYTLVACDPQVPIIISNTTDLKDYVGEYIRLFDDDLCYYVIKNESSICPNAVEVNINPEVLCTQCIPNCWYVSGNPISVTYVTIENEVITTSGNIKVCSIIPPVVTGTNGSIINLGECLNGECPELCFKLENCVTNEIIYSNAETLIQYIENTVTLNGYDGCWQVTLNIANCNCITVTFTGPGGTEIYTANANGVYNGYNLYEFTAYGDNAYIYFEPGKGWYISLNDYGNSPSEIVLGFTAFEEECPDSVNEGFIWNLGEVILNSIQTEVCPAECTCPIPVTVLQSFNDCPSCLPIIAYKFTNCNNQTLVQYSTEDYSEYVGKTVELECGGCWFVSQIDYTPPSTQTITILFTFDSCLICNRTYYKLVDCLEPAVNIVYTYTDLSQYLGQTIKIKGCDSCFTVLEETREPINPGIVEVTDNYIDCPECLEAFACVCNRITNQDTIAKDFTYIDCLFEEVTINLQPNETSDKVCLINWVLTPEEEALVYIEHFGNCINGQCPVEPLPKRKVKPGYSTPSCDIEKYEKITCKSSEIYYKQVMRLRYGISNCCPEDEEKWLVKKELIDLDALRDPDYICTPVTTCCSQPISSCGCGCNQTLKTCNSQ